MYMVLIFFTLFRYSILFLDEVDFVKSMKDSIKFVKKHFLISFLVILLLMTGNTIEWILNQSMNLIVRMLSLPLGLMIEVESLEITGIILLIILGLVFMVMSLIINYSRIILSDLFVFKIYKITKKDSKSQKHK